jgi:hypothetical protein
MSKDVGVWFEHKKASSCASGRVGALPHNSGLHEGGGEKKYEQRHSQDLDRYYDDVIGQNGQAERSSPPGAR